MNDLHPGLVAALVVDLDAGFADVVRAYQGLLLGTALRLTGDRPAAEDLAAEAFLRAFRALRDYDAERIAALELRGWLVTVLLNEHRNTVRTATRRPALSGAPLPERAAREPGPAEVATRGDPDLAAALAALPAVQRDAVVLRHVADLDVPAVAAALGVGEGTARSHVSRGLARLRTLLASPDRSAP
ncbi:sigma-70 family RNA polymerase sigma factor [Actinomycetospora sp. NBRC 106378]|uniref:RNA polymerase sigma factor n=1 Tax=Actinomycetospora sp. NBRC 106378 TaxID=3032208 RepID=UPI0024A4EDC6|nr:sigma-70 family RNA polymerase sigma factor [Actinomycetospora sp. NBRC 106378]GLZ52571.1 DNA-directed RNA polymerase sigma-70 factor [Actinomycetospora sp. NBRC 106378]